MAQLRQRGYADLVPHLPLDLYTLEMADQIEATVARAALGDAQPEARVFMDFVFHTDDNRQAVYRLDPYPFTEEPIKLDILYATLTSPMEMITAAEANVASNQRPRLNELQDWLETTFQDAPLHTREVTLCPWT
jgi:hypothetical protein